MANEYGTSVGQTSAGQDGFKAKAQGALSKVQDQASEKLESTVGDQKARAADKLSGVARSLFASSQTVRDNGQEDVSRYIEKAAGQVDRLANYLQRADVHEVIDQVEGFAKRQPAAFVASAFAVGFLASRFVKSSRRELGYATDGFDDTNRSLFGNPGPAGGAYSDGTYSTDEVNRGG
ncbi:MAG TPA: hypothetical protein VM100_07680 [Longimicrobiales bacterium]|nr:hypothetical protein [Longimicrobiales bacterium]